MEIKTLNEQIERLKGLIRKCYATVAGKNGAVPEMGERTMENLPAAIASTHDTLEELTITANGEYTPQEGVDGFSKVTAEFDTSSLPKVKVSQFKVTNECINDEGRWEGESLIDTSECSNLIGSFRSNTAIKTLDISNLVHSKITSLENTFRDCFNLEEINTSDWDTSNVTTLYHTFYRLGALKKLDVSNFDTRKVNSMYFTFAGCSSLTELDLSNWDVSNVTNMEGFLEGLMVTELDVSKWNVNNVINLNRALGSLMKVHSLDLTNWNISNVTKVGPYPLQDLGLRSGHNEVSIVGGRVIDDVINNNISALRGLKISCNLGYDNRQKFDRASLRAVINGLADLTGQTAKTLTLGATLIAKLTEEDIAIAVNKNWTVV